MPEAPVIRPVTAADHAGWLPLWQGYLAFYKAAVPDSVTAATWRRLLDPAEPMDALVADQDGRLIGLAQYLFHRSSWTIGNYCYLQDLFVDPAGRGGGLGRRLIAAVEEEARAAGASRLYWLTHETNTDARALYDKVAERSGFIQYRKIFA